MQQTKHLLTIAVPCLLLLGCNRLKQATRHTAFKAFDFSYNDVFSTCFSIKFTQGDTVFIQQYFPNADKGTKYAVISEQERNRVDSFINCLNFLKLSDKYYEPIQDGLTYQFYVEKDSAKKTIFVYGDSATSQLRSFAFWLADLKKKVTLVRLDTTIAFRSSKYVLPPDIQPPPIEFKPPKQRKHT